MQTGAENKFQKDFLMMKFKRSITMSEYERKARHLKTLKRTAATIERRIEQLEKELEHIRLTMYAAVNKE